MSTKQSPSFQEGDHYYSLYKENTQKRHLLLVGFWKSECTIQSLEVVLKLS